MSGIINVLAISGSLRKASYNTGLLRAACGAVPEGMRIEIYDGLADIPPYDDDVRNAGYPTAVTKLREKVQAADALLIASPEFNRAMSGVLKNAIDWVSRPPEPPFHGKIACVMTAATGALGGALANYDMRQVLSVCGVLVLPGKEIMVGGAKTKFDEAGNLIDEGVCSFIATHLATLAAYVRRMR